MTTTTTSETRHATVDRASRGEAAAVRVETVQSTGALIRAVEEYDLVFSTANARTLVNFAQANSFVRLLAYWAVDRDPSHAHLNIFHTFH